MINQPGQLSPDGTTYWNGTAWAPVAPPVKRGHKVRNAGIVVGGLVVLFVGVSLAGSGSSGTSTPAAAHKPTTATEAGLPLNGSALPRFSSSTIERSAVLRAAARFAGVSSARCTRVGLVNG